MTDGVMRVLVADDEEDIRLLCRVNLEAEGWVVEEACDAEQLLHVVRNHPRPQVIVLDWTMPGRSGWECLRELKADPDVQAIPVVMLSAHADAQTLRLAMDAGAADYVQKPFQTRHLTEAVRRVAGPVPSTDVDPAA